ncbi:MAG: TlpA disulfide reductase family protein, partial [Bacteroidota bacterium]
RAVTVLLADPAVHELTGTCQNPKATFKLSNAPQNDTYKQMFNRITAHNQRVQMLMNNLNIFRMSDPSQVSRIEQDLQAENNGYFGYLDSIAAKGGILAQVAGFYNFKPFMSDPSHSNYGNDLEYFKQTFMAGIDFNDPVVSAMPQVYEKARAFSANLVSRGVSADDIKSTLDRVLGGASEGTVGHSSVLSGFLGGLEQTKSDLYIDYGNKYIMAYGDDNKPFAGQVQSKISSMMRMRVGSPAPNIEQPTPEGKLVSLTSLQGQYVLVDFWASWCRPCRMENPNVKKAYDKYHKAGFEILGVSLDKSKDKWVQAIAQDGLPWKHVSDLGGWGSKPAQTYGVNSIPATVLVDKEGKIAARNLRGPALEKKLEEIFGF